MPTTRRQSGAAATAASYTSSDGNNLKRKAPHSYELDNMSGQHQAPATPSPTPRKTGKRVRFSDVVSSPSGTGLTPFIRRATLSPKRSSAKKSPRGRGARGHSVPTGLPTPPSSPFSNVQHMQFTPMRQEIGRRTRRQLRRSHMSEAQNVIFAEERIERRLSPQVKMLEAQIADLTWELESARQRGIDIGTAEEQIQTLKEELVAIKERNRAQAFSPLPPSSPPVEFDNDSNEGMGTTMGGDECFSSSPSTDRIYRQEPAHNKSSNMPPSPILTMSMEKDVTDASVQIMIPDPSHTATIQAFEQAVVKLKQESLVTIETFEQAVATLTEENLDTKASLSNFRDGLLRLGLVKINEGSSELTNKDLLAKIRLTIRTARLQLEDLIPGETVCSTENADQLLECLLQHISRLLSQNKIGAQQLSQQAQVHDVLRRQFNVVLTEKGELSDRLDVVVAHRAELVRETLKLEDRLDRLRDECRDNQALAAAKDEEITRVEQEKEEQSTTIERLQAAIVSYRDEVTSLESLISKMEQNAVGKDEELENVKTQMEEARDTVTEEKAEQGRTEIFVEEMTYEMRDKMDDMREEMDEKLFKLLSVVKRGLQNVTRRPSKRAGEKAAGIRATCGEGQGDATESNKRDSGFSTEGRTDEE